MKKIMMSLLVIGLVACNHTPEFLSADGTWIKGTDEEKIETIERHFQGFAVAMMETGYRYKELYWAGMDENWKYAAHQLEEMVEAIENGLERRPERAKSAESFLNDFLPPLEHSVNMQDSEEFSKNFLLFTTSCNNCHTLEDVAFIRIVSPTDWVSIVRK